MFQVGLPLSSGGVLGLSWQGTVGNGDLVFGKSAAILSRLPAACLQEGYFK